MRKLIIQVAVSLDGFIEGPNGEYDWCFNDQDYGLTAFFNRLDAVFYGRKSYELSESMAQSVEGGGMPTFPTLKTYVFSNTLKNVREGATLLSGDVEKEVRRIKNEEGKDIWLFGGAGLATSLMQMKLVDEIEVAVHPIVLGSGKPLFGQIPERTQLTLTASKTYSTGLVMLSYQVR